MDDKTDSQWLVLYSDEEGRICMDAGSAPSVEKYKEEFMARNPKVEIAGIYVRVE